ncbi:K(+)-transporting ATPase subunit C [Lentibacillus halophilus]|uniref:Potassium-transporting ATPase KdpC subunit n=1 Tax=Lentibacillus halophilus TaxID=295065 RepID=A0ABP3JBQ3_9BACI
MKQESHENGLGTIIRISLLIMLLCGLVYPAIMTGIAQATMPNKADGSLIYNEKEEIIGSELIGQHFTEPQYFHGRVSSIKYDASGSNSPNYAPSNPKLLKRVKASMEQWKQNNPKSYVTADLMTNSGSGLDPHISPESAQIQIPRVSEETGISEDKLKQLVQEHIDGPDLGIFGESRVNVLNLNLDLQEML